MKLKSPKNLLKISVIAASMIGGALVVQATITSGLAGSWTFSDGYGTTAPDASGLGNTGTLSGAAFFDNDPDRGQVLNINGISGEMEVPYSPSLTPASGTISIWVKPTQALTSDVIRMDTDLLVTCNHAGPAYAYDLRIDSKGTPVAIIADDDPKDCRKATQVVISGHANQVKQNVWTHMAMSWGSGTLALYVNGKQVSAGAYLPDATGLSYHGNTSLKVGAAIWDFGTGYLEYQGQLSDARLYSRALTSTEILQIATANQ